MSEKHLKEGIIFPYSYRIASNVVHVRCINFRLKLKAGTIFPIFSYHVNAGRKGQRNKVLTMKGLFGSCFYK